MGRRHLIRAQEAEIGPSKVEGTQPVRDEKPAVPVGYVRLSTLVLKGIMN